MKTVQEIQSTLNEYKEANGVFALQELLIYALVKSVTVKKAEFSGDNFKITIRNPQAK